MNASLRYVQYIKKMKTSDLKTNAFYANFYSCEGVGTIKHEVHETFLQTSVTNPLIRSYLTLVSRYGSGIGGNWSYL